MVVRGRVVCWKLKLLGQDRYDGGCPRARACSRVCATLVRRSNAPMHTFAVLALEDKVDTLSQSPRTCCLFPHAPSSCTRIQAAHIASWTCLTDTYLLLTGCQTLKRASRGAATMGALAEAGFMAMVEDFMMADIAEMDLKCLH